MLLGVLVGCFAAESSISSGLGAPAGALGSPWGTLGAPRGPRGVFTGNVGVLAAFWGSLWAALGRHRSTLSCALRVKYVPKQKPDKLQNKSYKERNRRVGARGGLGQAWVDLVSRFT